MQLTVVNHAFAGGKDAQRLARQLSADAEIPEPVEDADKSLDLLLAHAQARKPSPSAS